MTQCLENGICGRLGSKFPKRGLFRRFDFTFPDSRLHVQLALISDSPVRTKSLARRLESGGVAKEVRQG
jgi:hypothetical protein